MEPLISCGCGEFLGLSWWGGIDEVKIVGGK